MDWSGVNYLWVMFLSAIWTLILTAPIHCRGCTGEQVVAKCPNISSNKETKNLHLGWLEGENMFS